MGMKRIRYLSTSFANSFDRMIMHEWKHGKHRYNIPVSTNRHLRKEKNRRYFVKREHHVGSHNREQSRGELPAPGSTKMSKLLCRCCGFESEKNPKVLVGCEPEKFFLDPNPKKSFGSLNTALAFRNTRGYLIQAFRLYRVFFYRSKNIILVLRIRIRDPAQIYPLDPGWIFQDPGSGTFFVWWDNPLFFFHYPLLNCSDIH
jgi:hypothetical protein